MERALKVSVIVPCFNHERFLPTTIGSVLAQTHTDWELILVDDRSSDRSVEVARSFGEPRIRVFENDSNLGTYGTQNEGLKHATGVWVAILNSDDYWAPTKLEEQLALMEKHPEASFCYTLGAVVDDEGSELPDQDHHADYPTSEVQDLRLPLMGVNRVLASSVLFKRGAVEFDASFRYSGDWVAALQLSLQGPAVFLNKPLTYWRHHTSNASRELNFTVPEEIRVRWSIVANPELWANPSPAQRSALSLCYRRLADLFVLIGVMSLARSFYYSANMLQPGNRTTFKRFVASYLSKTWCQSHIWPGTDASAYEAKVPEYDLRAVNWKA